MAIQTKEQVLEGILQNTPPLCSYCGKPMSLWEVPPMTFGDGLGWGTPYLYVCYNDECSLYAGGWKTIRENYAHKASMRCINYPGTEVFECMPVFSSEGGKGQIIDGEILKEQEWQEQAIKAGFAELAECYRDKNAGKALEIFLDAVRPSRVRVKAAEILGDIGTAESIEPLVNHKCANSLLEAETTKAVAKLHGRHFTRECPFCAEIIKQRAKVCKHCGKELAEE